MATTNTRPLIFLSAQSDHPYYHWQVEVMILNFMRLGINPNHIEVLFCHRGPVSAAGRNLANAYPFVRFFFYENRISDDAGYASICRPHVLARHFEAFPELGRGPIFYHDCDILFRALPDFARLEADDACHLSDTISYIGARYIQGKGKDLLGEMSRIIGIEPQAVTAREEQSGGAQYLLKGIDAEFWRKVERDCRALYRYLAAREEAERKLLPPEKLAAYNPIQKWCTDMWAVLWNLWLRGLRTEVERGLSFSWATSRLQEWDKHPIYHNAGVVEALKETHFYKGEYIHRDPFRADLSYVKKESCSWHYAQSIQWASQERQRHWDSSPYVVR